MPADTSAAARRARIEAALDAALPASIAQPARLHHAMRHAVLGGGKRLRLPGRAHTHSVKKLLQSLAVPPWERARLPLVHAADGELVAVGDVLVSARLAALGVRFARFDAG